MKKNIFKTIICGFAVLALTSCANNWLDTEPSDGVDASSAITTDEELYSARTGLYYMFKISSITVHMNCGHMKNMLKHGQKPVLHTSRNRFLKL